MDEVGRSIRKVIERIVSLFGFLLECIVYDDALISISQSQQGLFEQSFNILPEWFNILKYRLI